MLKRKLVESESSTALRVLPTMGARQSSSPQVSLVAESIVSSKEQVGSIIAEWRLDQTAESEMVRGLFSGTSPPTASAIVWVLCQSATAASRAKCDATFQRVLQLASACGVSSSISITGASFTSQMSVVPPKCTRGLAILSEVCQANTLRLAERSMKVLLRLLEGSVIRTPKH